VKPISKELYAWQSNWICALKATAKSHLVCIIPWQTKVEQHLLATFAAHGTQRAPSASAG